MKTIKAHEHWSTLLTADSIQINDGIILNKWDYDEKLSVIDFSWEEEFLFYNCSVSFDSFLRGYEIKDGNVIVTNDDGLLLRLRPMLSINLF
jgi:hypothetical protein